MASYAKIRRNIIREFDLSAIETPYLPNENNVAKAVASYGESVKHIVDTAWYEPLKTMRPTLPYRLDYRRNMSGLFPTYHPNFWFDEFASAQNLSQNILDRTLEGKAVYGTFVRGLVASWKDSFLLRPPFNYLPYSQINPSHNTAYVEAARVMMAKPSQALEAVRSSFGFAQSSLAPSPAG